MRKIIVLILSLALVFSAFLTLTACSDDKEKNEEGGQLSDNNSADGEAGADGDASDTDGNEDSADGDGEAGADSENQNGSADGENSGSADTTPDVDNGGDTEQELLFPDNSLVLVKDGKRKFNIVYDIVDFHEGTKREILNFINQLENDGVIASITHDANASLVRDCEILVGTVENRDGYSVDVHTFGEEGYTVRVMDEKVIIIGGTDESTAEAVKYFRENCLTVLSDYKNVAIDKDFCYTHYQQYDITSVSVNGNDLSQFSIYCGEEDYHGSVAARDLRDMLYKKTGYWLDLTNEIDEYQIRFVKAERDLDKASFTARVSGSSLVLSSQYPALSSEDAIGFFAEYVGEGKTGEVSFDGSLDYSLFRHYISYAEFGAVGDGVTDDFAAIKNAHDAANVSGQTVVAEEGKTYNMGAHPESISITTDTIWTGASFIIDDSEVEANTKIAKSNVFNVPSSRSANQIDGIKTLIKGDTNVGVTFDGKYLLLIENSNVKQYIRYGENADSGANQQEIILVHPDGSIDPSTPLLWNYETVTHAIAYYADETPLTITGGIFYSIANKAERRYTYYNRGIGINRSNVTVSNVAHYVSGEGEDGAPYGGFLTVSCANNVRFENIIYSGHKTYTLIDNVNNRMGTYDISAGSSNAVTWYNCTQANSIYDKTLWGVMGSNYCKNLTYDGCVLSRFDAHKGMYNTVIRNSEIGHAGITAIGAGDLLIENCIINSNSAVSLRGDYGSTWDGDVIIRNVELRNTSSNATLINGSWSNHYFGYTCHLPRTVTVDNLKVAKGNTVYIFSSYGNKDITNSSTQNPVVVTEKVTVLNDTNGYSYVISMNKTVFGKTELIIE